MQLSNAMLRKGLPIIVTLVALQAGFSAFGSIMKFLDDGSICERHYSHWASRYVSYRETYKKRTWVFFRKTLTRINYRHENFVQWTTTKECCIGYSLQRATPLICDPECTSGCLHGKCSRPNVCECSTGYRTTLINGLSSCVPDCKGTNNDPEGCGEHGRCIAPDTCECHTGYTPTIKKLNPLDTPKHTLPCLPECKPECPINAHCHEPNNCQCNTGYRSASPEPRGAITECLPICEKDCVNGVCQSPNTCTCLPGYQQHPTEYSLCEPICDYDCINAICTNPNHCECHQGYKRNPFDPQHVCSPVCDPSCINANCTQPNNCECYEGYKKNSNGRMEACSPLCDPPCINATCTRPNECECNEGYAKNPNGPAQVCSPICDPPCINGDCTKPNFCECLHGYGKEPEFSSNVCSPICDPPCINSDCIEPNQCECHQGYKINPAGPPRVCLPICDPPCINAICYKPNQCKCYDGYRNEPEDPPQLCSAACDPPCSPNASCDLPNKCVCNVGYVTDIAMTLSSAVNKSLTDDIIDSKVQNSVICRPICEPECNRNASCLEPNLCRCNPGYRSASLPDENQSPEQCLPICDEDCVNAFCGYPNKCICHSGYSPSWGNDFACEPFCQHDCINANCTAPNHCECHEGYVKPGFVQDELHENLTVTDNLCVPSCHGECLNDICIAPDQCLCFSGYGLVDSPTNSSQRSCQPLCEPNCQSGFECIAPNKCQAQSDYSQDDNVLSTKLPDVDNITEICPHDGNSFDENGTYICKYGWAGSRCNEPSFCVLFLTADNETDEQSNIVPSGAIRNNQLRETGDDEANDGSTEELDWQVRKCTDECRISVLASNTSGNASDKIMRCHRLLLSNATNDFSSIEAQSVNSEGENKTIVCFVRAESECNLVETQVFSYHGTLYGVHKAIGIGLIVAAIALVTLMTYIIRQKRRNPKVVRGVSMCSSIVTEWPSDPDSTHRTITESSSL